MLILPWPLQSEPVSFSVYLFCTYIFLRMYHVILLFNWLFSLSLVLKRKLFGCRDRVLRSCSWQIMNSSTCLRNKHVSIQTTDQNYVLALIKSILLLMRLRTYIDDFILVDVVLPTQVSKIFSKAIWSEKPLTHNYECSLFPLHYYLFYRTVMIYLTHFTYLEFSCTDMDLSWLSCVDTSLLYLPRDQTLHPTEVVPSQLPSGKSLAPLKQV